jgi:hypothetical protein
MIDDKVMLRIFQDIWRWPPVVEAHTRMLDGRPVFTWDWTRGRRAIQRIAYLQIHSDLMAGLRRRVPVDCTDDELLQFLQRVTASARSCIPSEVSDEVLAVRLLVDGALTRISVPKDYRAPKVRTEKEALKEAQDLDEEEGVDESTSTRNVDPVDVSELPDE